MNKRIFTSLVVLCGACLSAIGQEADTPNVSILESTQIGFTHWTGSTDTPDYGSNTSGVTYSDNTLQFTTRVNGGNGTSSENMTVSVGFRLNMEQFIVDDDSQTQPTLLFTLNGAGETSGAANVWSGVGITQDGSDYKLAVYYGEGRENQPSNPTNGGVFSTSLPTSGSINVVMTVGSNGTTLYFNQGEDLPNTSHNVASAKWTGTHSGENIVNGRNVTRIQFAGEFTDDIEQFYIWNTTLDQTQAQEALAAMEAWSSPVQAVPEPATVALALLGLGGLFVRRRTA